MLTLLAVALAVALGGCSLATRAGVALLYDKADLPVSQIARDLCYTASSPCDTPRHTLDLYQPAGKAWPVIVFVHGGNWDSGDKNYRTGGADVYANIGRFYATRGIGVAVINYRLPPNVAWPAQVDDAREAAAWVRGNIERYGGRPDRVFLMGHSAGAHLVSQAALTTTSAGVRGVIAVSGAALDLTDEQTYQLGADRDYYRARFQGDDRSEEWKRRASPALFANAKAPPFPILYATGETKALQRQSQVLHETLTKAGGSSALVPIHGESQTRMVLVLSRADKAAAPAIVQFVGRFGG
ncbi:MAG: alpha/beta hydrolase [Acidobacteria bacterium]|nr:alpha/beta hydrolase [Acidobacteriota bacterium]